MADVDTRLSLAWGTIAAPLSRAELDAIAGQCGFVAAQRTGGSEPGVDLHISLDWSQDPKLTFDVGHRRITNEAYVLDLAETPCHALGVSTTANTVNTISVSSRRSLRWALTDLARRIESESWTSGRHECCPGFQTRGIIEGFYGTPWSHQARLSMIDFAAQNRFNTMMYAPKDDPYLRALWRVPHTDSELDRLAEFINRCGDRDIDAMVGISPGLSMQYSSQMDNDLLDAKIDSLVHMKTHRIALLLDDIPSGLQHPADIAAFSSLVQAQIEMANRIVDHLSNSGVGLTLCPTSYHGDGNEEYISRLGGGLDPGIDVFWTGAAICAAQITASEAATFTRSVNRPPLYWDNYPVNDVAMTSEMHIGPYRRRDPLLHHFSLGVMANAMEYAEASRIALATVADYLWDPERYDPEQSWSKAISRLAGPADAAALQAFADNSRGSCLAEPDPHLLGEAIERFGFDVRFGDALEAKQALARFAHQMQLHSRHLLSGDVANRALQGELRPWLEKFQVGADAVAAIAAFWPVAGNELSNEEREQLEQFRSQLANHSVQLFGNIIEFILDELIEGKETVT